MMASTAIEVRQQIESQAISWPERARSLKILDQDSLDQAGEELRGIKALRAAAEEHHKPTIDAARRTLDEARAALKRVDDPLSEAEQIYKSRIAFYAQSKEAEAREGQRRLQAQAEEEERKRRETEAAIAQEDGATPEQVEAIKTAPSTLPAPIVTPAYAKPTGVTMRENWSAEVTDLEALVKFAAKFKQFALLLPNQTALNALARSQKQAMKIPGVRAVNTPGVAARK